MVHRDISYTNILLRSRDEFEVSQSKLDKRREIMDELGLSQIDDFRRQVNCREGLLIDFDYASLLDPKKTTDQATASTVDESLGESSRQVSSEVSSEGDFEVVDDDNNSKTVIQPIANLNKVSGTRTVSYFYYCVRRPSDT
jgi:serine/threonine protein kinase